MFNLNAMQKENCMARKFTEEELEMIIQDYKSGMKPFEMADKYKRNSSSIINKLKSIGIFENARHHYTKDDEEFLRKEYPIGNWDLIMARFPNSSKHSIINKAYKLGIHADYYFWNEDDMKYLEQNYYNYSLEELANYFGNRYTKDAIQKQAWKTFGYSTDDDWTKEEDELLRKYYPTIPIDEVCKIISTRSKNAIINHSTVLGLYSYFYNCTYWNSEQNRILLENWDKMSDEELSIIIGKPKASVSERRRRIGLLRVDKDDLKYSDISKYLRGQLQEWKNKSMKNCNYQCVLTGSKSFHIHHIFSFNQIVSDFFNHSSYQIKDFSEYTQEELNNITAEFIVEHNKHPLGVCIRKDIHDMFHSVYGRYNNTQEQWNKFVQDYKNGLYMNTA